MAKQRLKEGDKITFRLGMMRRCTGTICELAMKSSGLHFRASCIAEENPWLGAEVLSTGRPWKTPKIPVQCITGVLERA